MQPQTHWKSKCMAYGYCASYRLYIKMSSRESVQVPYQRTNEQTMVRNQRKCPDTAMDLTQNWVPMGMARSHKENGIDSLLTHHECRSVS